MHLFLLYYYIVSLCLVRFSLARCPEEPLPETALYSDGHFFYPNGDPSCFKLGSKLNISWESNYETVNLWLIENDKFNEPVGLGLNIAATWYDWTVESPSKNRSSFYVFRIVNAQGTETEKRAGGFLSGYFYIDDRSDSGKVEKLDESNVKSADNDNDEDKYGSSESSGTTTSETSSSSSPPSSETELYTTLTVATAKVSPTPAPDSESGNGNDESEKDNGSSSIALSALLGMSLGLPAFIFGSLFW